MSKVLFVYHRLVKTSSIGSFSNNLSETTSVVSISNSEAGYKKPHQQGSNPTLSRRISTISSRKEDVPGQEREVEF